MARGRNIQQVFTFLSLLAFAACAPSGRSEPEGSDTASDSDSDSDNDNDTSDDFDGLFIDASTVIIDASQTDLVDAGNVYPDADNSGPSKCEVNCPPPPASGCTPNEVCGNGSDDDCDGKVDESCGCAPGSVQACFANVPGKRHVGACQDGQQTCQGSGEFTQWGPCEGGIQPKAETCDSLDNDCNGCVDDAEDCCNVDLECPASMPEGSPFTAYIINGTDFYEGPVSTWTWTVTGGPCDQLLAPKVSFQLNGAQATTVSGATLSTLNFLPTLSGDYTVNVKMKLPDGTTIECTFIVHITGPGLRIEMCWDTQGDTDIDLHLHKPGTTTPWFTKDGTTNTAASNINGDDCYYENCKADNHSSPAIYGAPPNWGYMNSPLSECSGSQSGGTWVSVGYCANPRLDIDNIFSEGVAENINVDKPENGKTYRVGVHYYSGEVQTAPMVNVYCGGTLLATYGKAPDQVPGFTHGDGFGLGTIWRVVDVTTQVDATGKTTGCDLSLLNPPGTTSGYHVTCPNENPDPDINCVDTSY
jgi:hypothetical protein